MAPTQDEELKGRYSEVQEHMVDLSRLLHLFYRNSSALKSPGGKEFIRRTLAVHPMVEQAVEMFSKGDGEGAGDLILKLLIASGVEFDDIVHEQENIGGFEATLFGEKRKNWYERAKESVQAQPVVNKKCLDGNSLSKPFELWLAGRPAREMYSPALQWLDRMYDGKPAKWWLTNCVTGLPFTVEPLTWARVKPVLLSLKPDGGHAAMRIIIQRENGKVVIVWWGPHGEYDDFTSSGNYSRLAKLPRTPVLQIPL
jgi:hypothetical protein